ncbi:MAG: hypothetical protein Q8P42_00260 [Gallionella sp.]|nr:hypothetical protein [Gallionella sp.]
MANQEIEIIMEPKYAPPYPQSFYAFWPKHAIKAGTLISLILLGLLLLAFFIRVPMDPNMPPMPDEGAYVPAPEWYLFFLFQPFWYLAGDNAKWLPIGTFWLPLLVVVFLFLIPFIFRKRKDSRAGIKAATLLSAAVYAVLVWAVPVGAVVASGAPAKTLGCPSCHNPMMGERQALPPANMGEYYRVERQRQVNLGGYNMGSDDHAGGSYKDANWQLRHFYEPTMTW